MLCIAIALSLCVGSCLGTYEFVGYNQLVMHQLFKQLDLNSDGVLTKDEILYGCKDGFSIYDINGNGKVSRHEFVETICQFWPDIVPFAHYMYDDLDLNNDHIVDAPDYDLIFAQMDLNADGQVFYEEYSAYKRRALDQFFDAGPHALTHSSCH